MTTLLTQLPLIALVDDDIHSARLLCRTLYRLGAKRVNWHGDAARSLRLLIPACAEINDNWPRLVIVDLKASSTATIDFLRQLKPLLPKGIALVALAPTLERNVREALIEAGAEAVFERQGDQLAYREEMASLVRFLNHHVATYAETAHVNLISSTNDDPRVVFLRPNSGMNEEHRRLLRI